MKLGSKYQPLYETLAHCQEEALTLTMTDIEKVIGGKLPPSALNTQSWWSNRSKGGHQSSAWIEAGFHTAAINLAQKTVTFKKYYPVEYKIERVNGEIRWDKAAIRALRKHMNLTQSAFADTIGVRRQTISEWENGVYLPDRSTMKHLGLIAEKEAFEPLP